MAGSVLASPREIWSGGTLSDDGETLTIVRHFKTSMGEDGHKLVLEKQ